MLSPAMFSIFHNLHGESTTFLCRHGAAASHTPHPRAKLGPEAGHPLEIFEPQNSVVPSRPPSGIRQRPLGALGGSRSDSVTTWPHTHHTQRNRTQTFYLTFPRYSSGVMRFMPGLVIF